MATGTGFNFKDGSGNDVDMVTKYELRATGQTGTTNYYSNAYGKDLGSIFYLYSNLGALGLTGNTGTNSGYSLSNGTDIGSLFCIKGSVVSSTSVSSGTGLLSTIPTGCVGLFACKWVNNNYTGPILKLRKSSDTSGSNYTDFYMDKTGTVITTAAYGTGTTFATWLGADTAYVNTWYDQSGLGKHATQTTTTLQPIFIITNKSIKFDTTRYLIIDSTNSTLFSNGNVPYTIVFQSALSSTLSSGAFPTIFTTGLQNSINNAIYPSISTTTLTNAFYGNNLIYTRTPTNNEIGTYTYDGTNRRIYLNNNLMISDTTTALNIINSGGKSYIGFCEGGANKFTGNIGFLYVFNNVLTDTNRTMMQTVQ